MKFLIYYLLFIAIFFNACSSEHNKDFFLNIGGSDCEVVKSQCVRENHNNREKSRAQIMQECETARAMCEAVKTKGCLQQCLVDFEKNSPEHERCKERCRNKNK